MSEATWAAVDEYVLSKLIREDPSLAAAMDDRRAADMPEIEVSPIEGMHLHLLARMSGAKRVLEVGTLAGYSTIWLARAVPDDGCVVTLELDPKHAAVARKNVDRADVGDKVEILEGQALASLEQLGAAGGEPFDFVFIDADKENNPPYFQWAMRLGRPGTVIVVDNVARRGKLADASSDDPSVNGVRQMFDLIENEPRVDATAIQTVGARGYDGFLIAIMR